jgi:hypothetical protein
MRKQSVHVTFFLVLGRVLAHGGSNDGAGWIVDG